MMAGSSPIVSASLRSRATRQRNDQAIIRALVLWAACAWVATSSAYPLAPSRSPSSTARIPRHIGTNQPYVGERSRSATRAYPAMSASTPIRSPSSNRARSRMRRASSSSSAWPRARVSIRSAASIRASTKSGPDRASQKAARAATSASVSPTRRAMAAASSARPARSSGDAVAVPITDSRARTAARSALSWSGRSRRASSRNGAWSTSNMSTSKPPNPPPIASTAHASSSPSAASRAFCATARRVSRPAPIWPASTCAWPSRRRTVRSPTPRSTAKR